MTTTRRAWRWLVWSLPLCNLSALAQVAGDFGFAEGPVGDDSGFLYVSDEEKNKIYRVLLDGRKEELASLGDPEASTYDRQHRLIDCASVLRAIIALTPDGKYTGPVSIMTFGSEQYVWHSEGANSHADPNVPPVKITVPTEPDRLFTLPKSSISVLRGSVERKGPHE